MKKGRRYATSEGYQGTVLHVSSLSYWTRYTGEELFPKHLSCWFRLLTEVTVLSASISRLAHPTSGDFTQGAKLNFFLNRHGLL